MHAWPSLQMQGMFQIVAVRIRVLVVRREYINIELATEMFEQCAIYTFGQPRVFSGDVSRSFENVAIFRVVTQLYVHLKRN